MKSYLLYIVLFFCITQSLYAQDDGVVAFSLPVRNSLKFNKYAINPTFSFVREQNKYISFTNKRQWAQFENAPQTYLFSYSGRFGENVGMGIGLFQQNYGVLTTFGGVLNFAHNAVLDRDSNLTFGMNIGFYKSGISEGHVVTNFPDPSLDNIPSNSLITINPGINYGTTFLDFGVSLNNIVLYNLKTSELVKDNPEQSIQAHVMYTGYINSRGFFDESKFSGLLRSEFSKDKTIISSILMLTIPKGMWTQIGYNTLYGASAGLGFKISEQIAIEYNFEKAVGDLSGFGSSHEITLAFKFNKNERYNYGDDDSEEGALIQPAKRVNRSVSKSKYTVRKKPKTVAERKLAAETKAKANAEAKAKIAARKVRAEEASKIKLAAEAKAKEDAEAKAKLAIEQAKVKAEEATRIKLAAETKAKEDAETKAKLETQPIDENTKSINNLTKVANDTKLEQEQLLTRLTETVAIKKQDLKDLKEENDLSEQGIFTAPKAFKSVTAENAELESLKVQIDGIISAQNLKITELENLYNERVKNAPNAQDSIQMIYLNEIEIIKKQQTKTIREKASLVSELEEIKKATEIERKRRIKRAAYDNEQDRYNKDRATLNIIKENTPISSTPIKEEDFDFGEVQNSNIQILKEVKNVEKGYYAVVAVHTDVAKRDEFLAKAVASGETNINFFYDVNTSKYYIFYEKFDDIETAQKALQAKGSEPYNGKMSLVKIEN